ncbi:MAG TPA: MMPL family transporter [Steroidobacteraceae bacterium]|nr:MMPL family transporter [Steroidobacteraceae bacterium]
MTHDEKRHVTKAPESQELTLNSIYSRLGTWVAARPKRVLFAWLIVIAVGAWGAHRLPDAAVGGTGDIEGSASAAVSSALRTEFTNPFIDPLVVAVSAPALDLDQEPYRAWVRHAAGVIGALPEVRKVSSYIDARDAHMRSADGHVTMLLVGLAATNIEGQQRAVVAVRGALVPLRAALMAQDRAAQLAVTGGAAGDFDVNALSAAGGDRAEKRALPLTLAILAVAFGTLIAAGLPFLMGLATTTVALGAAFLLAEIFTVSNLLSNVVTMVGLAIGIDYSLLMVTHYREHSPERSAALTVAAAVAEAGETISWSGVTVMVGFLGLLFSPILETRCAGIGGALVVCISVLAALTLLPAILVLSSPYLDRWPVLPRRWRRGSTTAVWLRLGNWILRHPLAALILSAACVLAIALPVFSAKLGVTTERWFLPRMSESRVGAEILTAMRSDNASIPIFAIVRTTDGTPVLDTSHLEPLADYADRLQRDRRIAEVASPVTLRAGLSVAQYTGLYRNLDRALADNPSIGELFLSRDRRAALFEITPAGGLTALAIGRLTRDVAALAPDGPFSVMIGGSPAYDNDFSDYMLRSLPRIVAFVVGATLVLLFFAFRSYLLPLKAVVTNLLAVAAGIGAVVAVFQMGWLNGLVGLERPFSVVPLEVPMMVFCLSFGLSMDYELFLLFRIQREFERHGDNDRATVEGLAAVAPVITGAGLIMAVVFGAFAGAELPVLKMMGVGLCVSVLIDATVIRAFVVPAIMVLAGRWNWYPGRYRRPEEPALKRSAGS